MRPPITAIAPAKQGCPTAFKEGRRGRAGDTGSLRTGLGIVSGLQHSAARHRGSNPAPDGANVVVNRPAAEAGLALLDAGDDFPDGVIAYEGNWLGADAFVSFDKKAVKLMKAKGGSARPLD
jgi:hypothetical protein